MKTSGIDKYSTFGMKENWVSDFFNNSDDYFEGNNSLGTKMIPACLNWFREAEILEISDKKISKTGLLLQSAFNNNPTLVWEIMWINLSNNSKIVEFYTSNIKQKVFIANLECRVSGLKRFCEHSKKKKTEC